MFVLLKVSESSDLFCGKPLQIDLDHQRIGLHNVIPQQQTHHIGMVKTLEKKDLIPHDATTPDIKGKHVYGELVYINGQLQKQQHTCNECDRLFTRPERLRQHHAYKHTGNNNVGNNGSNTNSNGSTISPTTNLGGSSSK